jgi:hypothetical protein
LKLIIFVLFIFISQFGFAVNSSCNVVAKCKVATATCMASASPYIKYLSGTVRNSAECGANGKFLTCTMISYFENGNIEHVYSEYACCLASGAAFVTSDLPEAKQKCDGY